jgi:hypothetical protein
MLVIDEVAGRVGQVQLGATLEQVQAAFGPGIVNPPTLTGDRKPALPSGMGAPPGTRPGDLVTTVRCPDAIVFIGQRSGMYGMYVWRTGTRTAGGIEFGQPRSVILKRYPHASCGRVVGDREHQGYEYCRTKVGPHYVWWGGDPIESMAVGLSPIY